MGKSITEFRFSVVKVAILAVFSMILAVGFFAAAINSPANPLLTLFLMVAAAFFTLWSLGIGSHLLDRRVVLAFGARGILDRRIGPDVIAWRDIDEIYLFRARSQRFLAVVVADPDRYARPRHWADKLSLWINKTVGLPRFSLALMGLDGSTRQIMDAMIWHLPDQFDQDSIIR